MIVVTKTTESYELRDGDVHITAIVDTGIEKTISITGLRDKFWFCNSDPKLVKTIAKLILEATKLVL
jgi:hypothetical protein